MTTKSEGERLERQRDIYVRSMDIASRLIANTNENTCADIILTLGAEIPQSHCLLKLEATKAMADMVWDHIMAFNGPYTPTDEEMARPCHRRRMTPRTHKKVYSWNRPTW